MNTHFLNGWPTEVDIAFRLVLAYVLSAIIGVDREMAGRGAGLRTHVIIGSGAAGFTLVFIFGFIGAGTSLDAAHSAAQIVTGIGFLGAGTIWRSGNQVHGLTTAADLWAVGSVGMMAGSGSWFLACLMTFMLFVTLRFLRRLEPFLSSVKREAMQNQAEENHSNEKTDVEAHK